MNLTEIAKIALDEVVTEEMETIANDHCDCPCCDDGSVSVEDAMLDLTAHDKTYHGGKFDEKTMTCKLRERLAQSDKSDSTVSATTGTQQASGSANPGSSTTAAAQPAGPNSPKALALLNKLLAADPIGPKAAAYQAAIAKLQAATQTAPNPTASKSASTGPKLPSDADFDSAMAYLQQNPDPAASQQMKELPEKLFDAAQNIEDIELAKKDVTDPDALKMLDAMIDEQEKNLSQHMNDIRALVDDLNKKDKAAKAAAASAQQAQAQASVQQQSTTTQASVQGQQQASGAQQTTPTPTSKQKKQSAPAPKIANFMNGNTMVTDGADGATINAARQAAGLPQLKALDNIDALVSAAASGFKSQSSKLATMAGDAALKCSTQKEFDIANKNFAETVKNMVNNGRICTVMKPHRLMELLTSGKFRNKYDTDNERQEQMSVAFGIPEGSSDGAEQSSFSGTCLSRDVNRMFQSQAFNVYGLVAVEWKKDGNLVPCFSSSDAGEPLREEYNHQNRRARRFTPSLVSNPSIVSLPAFENNGYRMRQLMDPNLVQNPLGEVTPSGMRITPQAAAIKLFKNGPLQGDALDFDNAVNQANQSPIVYNGGQKRYTGWNEMMMLGHGTTDQIKALHINSAKWQEAIKNAASMSSNNARTSPINGTWSDAKSFVDDLVKAHGPALQQMGIQLVLDGQDVMSPGTPVMDEALSLSLAKHDAKYHGGQFDGNSVCKYRQQLAEKDESDTSIPDPDNVAEEEPEARYGSVSAGWVVADQSPCEASYDEVEEFGIGDVRTEVVDDLPEDQQMDEIYRLAKENLDPLEELTKIAANKSGYFKISRPTNDDERGMRIKTKSRAKAKADQHYGSDYGKLSDLIGTTIVVPDEGSFKTALENIKSSLPAGASVVRVKPFNHKETDGYQDIKVNVRFRNGGLGEIILANAGMNDTKFNKGGHVIYDVSREIRDRKIRNQLWDLSKMAYARGPKAPSRQEFKQAKLDCVAAIEDYMENLSDLRQKEILEQALSNWGFIAPPDQTEYRYKKGS